METQVFFGKLSQKTENLLTSPLVTDKILCVKATTALTVLIIGKVLIMKKSVYIETTIPSFAVSRLSRDTIVAGQQVATNLFWETERQNYDFYVSQYVIDECSQGDPKLAERRLAFLKDIPVIPKSEQVSELAGQYKRLLNIPDRSIIDSFHLAVCVVAQIDYLLSWNCAHLGIHTYARVQKYNDACGLFTPLLLTPEALTGIHQSEDNYD